jgi:aspartyl protease family protein
MSAQGRNGGGWIWYILAGLGAFALASLLSYLFPGALEAEGNSQRLVYLVLLLALFGGGALARVARQPGPALRSTSGHTAMWVGIGLVLLLGYGYRAEVGDAGRRLSAVLLPSRGEVIGGRNMRFTLGMDHHFHIDGLVGGTPVRFLVDTGATEVMLSPADARRLGLDPAVLAYTQIYRTANGIARGAPVTLPEIVVGTIRLTDVSASVAERDTGGSLLGMSFLSRLSGYEVSGDMLTLRQ